MKKGSIFVLILGAVGIVAGIFMKSFRPTMATYADALVAGGGLLLIAYLYVERGRLAKAAATRQVKYGANTLVYSIIVLAIVAAANYAGSLHVKRFDLTEEKLYSISPQTKKVLDGLDKDVQILAFFTSVSERRPKARSLLDLYDRGASRLKVRFVDPQQEPALSGKYDVRVDETIVVECGAKKTSVTNISEEEFTNALIKVTTTEKKTVYVAEGDGEIPLSGEGARSLSSAEKLLTDKSFAVKPVNLNQVPEVPRDASCLLLADPDHSLSERGVNLLDRYLSEGGRVLALLDVGHDGGIRKILEKRGISLGDDLVVDPTLQMLGGSAVDLIVSGRRYRYHSITKKFPLTTYLRMARSVLPAEKLPEGMTVDTLFECSSAGWAETDLKSEVANFDEGVDKKGPVSLAVAAHFDVSEPQQEAEEKDSEEKEPEEKQEDGQDAAKNEGSAETPAGEASKPDATDASGSDAADASGAKAGDDGAEGSPSGTEEPVQVSLKPGGKAPALPEFKTRAKEGRLVVVGDGDFASNGILPDTRTGNGPLLVNMVSWLTEAENLIAVPAKKPKNYSVQIPREQGYLLALLTLVGIPGGIMVYGIAGWWRRRKL